LRIAKYTVGLYHAKIDVLASMSFLTKMSLKIAVRLWYN